jgi:outer membrane protein assembly factor BamB
VRGAVNFTTRHAPTNIDIDQRAAGTVESMFEDNLRQLDAELTRGGKPAGESPSRELRDLLLGETHKTDRLCELPALPDLIAAVTALCSGARRKAILALSGAPAEFALVRRGERVLIDCYGTESAPEIFLREREIGLHELLAACVDAGRRSAQVHDGTTLGAALRELARRLSETEVRPDTHPRIAPASCSGGSLHSPGAKVPLAFGFSAEIAPGLDPAPESHAFADVHALLFHGALWAFAGEKRVALFEGPVMLAAQRMVAAVRALLDAWQADRNVHVRLRSAGFWIAVRRERKGPVSLTLSSGRGDALTWPALDVRQAALPILRLASDLIRKLIATDRRQCQNLRVGALRAEVRALRKIIRARERLESFENADPERLRLSEPGPEPERKSAPQRRHLSALPSALRYSQRWSAEIDGLDASSLWLCGEQLVVATAKLTLALARGTGEVLWSLPTGGAVTMMAGRALLRLLPDGELSLHEVDDGSAYAHAQITPRSGSEGPALFAAGGALPPMAILSETRQHLCAIDLRTGQPRWRFRAHGHSGLSLARSGRVLLVTSGDGTLDALDLASGEVVWRFSDSVRFCLKPCMWRDVAIAVAGSPSGGTGAVYGIELYSGKLLWQRELPAAPSSDPRCAGDLLIAPFGRSQKARLLALDPRSGEPRWNQADPGLDNGAQALDLDGSLVVNAPSGRLVALDLGSGETRWTRALSNPLTDDVPRQLEPSLRQGALFVPSAQVHVLRPQDGTPLSNVGCDLVPDWLRVDERGWFYVAEESGHICAYAVAPHLSLVK